MMILEEGGINGIKGAFFVLPVMKLVKRMFY